MPKWEQRKESSAWYSQFEIHMKFIMMFTKQENIDLSRQDDALNFAPVLLRSSCHVTDYCSEEHRLRRALKWCIPQLIHRDSIETVDCEHATGAKQKTQLCIQHKKFSCPNLSEQPKHSESQQSHHKSRGD